MNKKTATLLLLIASIFFALLAIALLVFGIIYNGGTLAKVLLFVAAALVLALAIELGYLFMLSKDTKPNFFLFNSATNHNAKPESLDFDTINTRMNKYLSAFSSSEGKLWTDGILDAPDIEIDDHFKPVVAYKLLLDIAEHDTEAGWRCFLLASAETVEFVAAGVEKNGDDEMAQTLRQLKATNPINMKYVRDYLVGNKRYIQKRMYKYVIDNIDLF